MDDLSRKLDYEESANEYWRWVLAAENLLISTDILEREYKNSLQLVNNSKEGKLPLEAQILSQVLYFKCKALELFLKALYVKQGNVITKDGSLSLKTHDLGKLCDCTEIEYGDTEKKILKKMSDCIIFWGTYPVPTKSEKWRSEFDGSVVGIPPIYSWSKLDDDFLNNILKQVRSLVDLDKDNNLPWSEK